MFFASRWSAVLFESHHPEYPYKNRGYLTVSSAFMGWVMGFEPTNTGTTIRCLRPLGDTHHIDTEKMARQKGLEPLTYCLEGSCSIQLSYWRRIKNMERVMGIEPTRPAWKAGVLPLNYTRGTPTSYILAHTSLASQAIFSFFAKFSSVMVVLPS